MKGIVIKTRLSRNIQAMALWPFILTEVKSDSVLNHERIHLSQQIELLVIPFYIWYGLEYLIHRIKGYNHWAAYNLISFEREAHHNENNPNYLKTRKFWAFTKYLK